LINTKLIYWQIFSRKSCNDQT